MKKYNVAVVGVGAVGVEMLRALTQRKFPIGRLRVFARSERDITVDGKTYRVVAIHPDGFKEIDIALFAGTEGEKGAAVTYAPEAVGRGAVVIDNGADFRLKPEVPLVVPEVNGEDVKRHKGIIANPNCSTIQMVVALWPIYKLSRITRVIAATYQAASGAGQRAAEELLAQTGAVLAHQKVTPQALPQRIAFNIFPQIGGFGEADYTSEEWKMVRETHKIFHDDAIKISATCARVPVVTGHSEAVYLETDQPLAVDQIRSALAAAPGIKVVDSPEDGRYPNAFESEGKDEVFVGRIRRDPSVPNAYWLWIVSDNLKKGAALNAVQIAELLIQG